MSQREPRLKTLNLDLCSREELLSSTFKRDSFFKLYHTLHLINKEEVEKRVNSVITYSDSSEFEDEIRLCYRAALLSGPKQTYSFNVYLISLVELFYSNITFSIGQEREIKAEDIVYYPHASISYEWVLFSNILNRYQRYLLFEFFVLGYNVSELARKRYCTTRTIYNHFNSIVSELDS